ncbi:MAG TPA: TlpA disulfide reductase family protein [Pirellulales bacterium]|nr:TlpA disulfide reductase family protein [Pirellulales bacterium]
MGRSHPAVGQKLPPVELTPLTFEGDPITSADLTGRVVVLNFWGTWCPPCLMELPHIAQLGQRYGDDERFKLLAVSCGSGPAAHDRVDDLQGHTAALLQRAKLPLAAYADPAGKTRQRLAAAGLFEHGYPTNLVIDREGVVRGVWIGYRPGVEHQIAALVDELLAK